MRRALGIILAGGNSRRMRELTRKRAIAAMPVAGSYRAIDFALSSMVGSRISKVAVITQYNSRSLNEHLNSPKCWDLGGNQGGLCVFNPTIPAANRDWYRGTADALAQNLNFLRDSHEAYVVIAAGDGIYQLDFNKVLDYHIAKDADITVVCKDMPATEDITRFGVVETNEAGRIINFEEKPVLSSYRTISCGIYVIRRRLLIQLLEQCVEMDWYDFVRDVLMRQKNSRPIYAYPMEDYWASISTVDAYYACNMDFLKTEVRESFFCGYPEILTKVEDNPPAKYNPGAQVSGSLIANGAIIHGMVDQSVIFKNVYIGSGCVIRNSLILNGAYVEDGCVLENCIVEARNRVPSRSVYRGEGEQIQIVTGLK